MWNVAARYLQYKLKGNILRTWDHGWEEHCGHENELIGVGDNQVDVIQGLSPEWKVGGSDGEGSTQQRTRDSTPLS